MNRKWQARPWVRALLVLLFSSLLTGCPPKTHTRYSCPAFDLSVIADWAPHQPGSSVVFADASGNQQVYRLVSIEDGHKSTQTVFSGNPYCILASNHLYVADDNSHAIRLKFFYRDLEPGETEVSIRPQEPVGTETDGYSYLLLLWDMAKKNNYASDEVEVIYTESLQVGQSTYNDVLSYSVLPNADRPPFNLPAEKQFRIKRIVFARHAGLVGMEYEDGRFFTLVQ